MNRHTPLVATLGLLLLSACTPASGPTDTSSSSSADMNASSQDMMSSPGTTDLSSSSSLSAMMPSSKAMSASANSSEAPQTVLIQNFAFSVQTLRVKQGTAVMWKNEDSTSHTVTGDAGAPASGTLAPGASYSYTFNTIGTFSYHCSIHPSMQAVVIVVP